MGFRLGLPLELVKLLGVTGGFSLSFRYYQRFGDFLTHQTFLGVAWASAMAMVILVMVVYLVFVTLVRLLGKLAQVTFQPKLNKGGGMVIGLIRAILVTSVILVVCRQFPSPYLSGSIDEHSFSGPVLSRVAPAVYDATSPICGRFLRALRAQNS